MWYQEANPLLPQRVLAEIKSMKNRVLFSQISLIEIAVKQKIGKLPDFKASVDMIAGQGIADGFEFLPIDNRHIRNYENIPLFQDHRDPFDRLLIATAEAESASIITADRNFLLYESSIHILW